MGLFEKPELTILKESSDARKYLEQLESLQEKIPVGTELSNRIGKEITITKAGIIGEDAILFELKYSGMDLVVLHDLYIETADGKGAQIDYLVITPYVNVFIECKNLIGDIEINNKGDFIRTFSYGGRKFREGIYSPVTQNERHLTVVKERRAEDKNAILRLGMEKWFSEFNKSLVVLSNPKTVLNDRFAPKEIREKVIRSDQLIAALKAYKSSDKSSKKDMLKAGDRYLSMNCENRKEYISKFQKIKEEIAETKVNGQNQQVKSENTAMVEGDAGNDKLQCPRCGKELVLRVAKKGENAGRQFYGCSGFPHCRYIRNI